MAPSLPGHSWGHAGQSASQAGSGGRALQGAAGEPCRQRPRRRCIGLAAVAVAAILGAAGLSGALPQPERSRLRWQVQPPVEFNAEEVPDEGPSIEALHDALAKVELLETEVDNGHVVKKFGERAQDILTGLPPEVEEAVDGTLQALFIRQLVLVQQELLSEFEHDRHPATALTRADEQFVAEAEELIRPGSDWSYEPERAALQASLGDAIRQDAMLSQERSRAVQTQRATADVIGKLQKQMEQMGEKLHGPGNSGPWVLWTSYRIPGTPLQVSGRYQQGRTNIELSLTPNKDPANAEAGFVEGLTAQNLGLSLNIGV